MTFQHLTVSMFENSKASNGFIDQKEFKTNLSYTFDSLVLDALPTRVIALYVEHDCAPFTESAKRLFVTNEKWYSVQKT